MRLIRVTDKPKDIENDKKATEHWCNSLDKFLEELKKKGFEIKELKRKIDSVDYWNLEKAEKAFGINHVSTAIKEGPKISVKEQKEEEYIDPYTSRFKKSEHQVMQQKLNN